LYSSRPTETSKFKLVGWPVLDLLGRVARTDNASCTFPLKTVFFLHSRSRGSQEPEALLGIFGTFVQGVGWMEATGVGPRGVAGFARQVVALPARATVS
jgi:hypothetical protein